MHRTFIRSTQNTHRTLSKVLIQQYQRNILASRYSSSTATRTSNNEATTTIQHTESINTLKKRTTAAFGNDPLQPSNIDQLIKEALQDKSKRNPALYNDLLAQYIRAGQPENAFNALVDVVNHGIQYTVGHYNHLLKILANSRNTSTLIKVVHFMEQQQVPLSVMAYQNIFRAISQQDDLDLMMEYLDKMKKQGLEPTLFCYSDIVSHCLRRNEPAIAFRMMKEAEAADLPLRRDPRLLMDVLRVSALNDQLEETRYSWNKAVNEFELRPDEGCCLHVLGVAARLGDSKLATHVIQQLSNSGYSYKEHYFVPLMEAFVVENDLKSAFDVLDIMRMSDVVPTVRSTISISDKLSSSIEAIDKAYYVLEDMKKDGKKVDVAAFNIVVSACGMARDIGRTVATFREASNLGVVPDIDTYNAVLDACIRTETTGMGQIVYDELKKANVAPNMDTFTKMIMLICKQSNYEDAFVYLEEMKHQGMTPPRYCYIVLATKLALEKDTRFHLALEEMETYGSRPSAHLKSLWK
ncbi:hypothetical protein BCR42DRAFT_374761 [Absidia repens]|uniref:Pentatricopeptide repeat-containing protein-mitochondrial domain-containing protein n=1 Tax=Absidia repens TaxID=90262 RepID=A0A1X2IGQ4_9FUNG|nr:hypothetical protein BCR42DRAFT_374761 [Absidia repens]